jgi:hypothetical protein
MILTKFGIFRYFYRNVSVSNIFSEYFERFADSCMVVHDHTVEHGEGEG